MMASMVFGGRREILNSNLVSSAMMVVFAQFLIIKIFDSNVSIRHIAVKYLDC